MRRKILGLKALEVLYLDCQTTGAVPPKAHIIELGWGRGQQMRSSLVALPGEETLPKRIASLTGIGAAELCNAPTLDEVWHEIWRDQDPEVPCVVHYAQFENKFFRAIEGVQVENIICTFEIARRLFPDLPSRSIRALSGYLGHHTEELKRSLHHVQATAHIWSHLSELLERDHGIKDFNRLKDWLAETPVPKARKKKYALAPEKRLCLPDKPGVYHLLHKDGHVLYVGKATSLKSRVNSYFRGQSTKGARLNELTTQVADIKVQQVSSPLEAALVEAEAIKRYEPPYNRAQKSQGRQIGFCSVNFKPKMEGKKGDFGPFSSLGFIEHIVSLMQALEGNSEVLESFAELEENVLLNGLAFYRQKFLLDGKSWRRILIEHWAESIRRARERRLAVEDEDGEDEVQKEADREWQPEDVCHYVVRSFAGFARRIHRSRWLQRLVNCSLYWRYPNSRKWLRLDVRGGEITFGQPLAEFKSKEKIFSKPVQFNLVLYDRMQVLSMEVRRLLREGCEVRLLPETGQMLDETQLARLMFPGDFIEEAQTQHH